MITGEKRNETIEEAQMGQVVRLTDMFLITPVLIYAGTRKSLPIWLRISLLVIGSSCFFGATYCYLRSGDLLYRINKKIINKRIEKDAEKLVVKVKTESVSHLSNKLLSQNSNLKKSE